MPKMQVVSIRGRELVPGTFAGKLALFVIPESIENLWVGSNGWIVEYVGARHAEAGSLGQMQTIRER